MKSSVYISPERIEAIGYTKSGRSFKINKYKVYYLPEGVMADGVITDGGVLTQCLDSMRRENPGLFKNTSLVIDGGSVSVKKFPAPKLKRRQYYRLIKDEFSDAADNFRELLLDYSIVKGKNNEAEILSCAADRNQAEEYISVFRNAGIKLKSVHIGAQTVMSYIESKLEFQNETLVINVIDALTMLSAIFENGVNVFMSRVRLNGENKESFLNDIANNLSGLVRFAKSEKISDITRVCYLGLEKGDTDIINSLNRHKEIEITEIETTGKDPENPEALPEALFAYLNIHLVSSPDGIDLIQSIKTLNQFKELTRPRRPEIAAFLAIVTLLAGTVVYFASQIYELTGNIEKIKGDIADVSVKSAELDEIMNRTAKYSDIEIQLNQKKEAGNKLPEITNEILDLIFNADGEKITVSRIEFDESAGIIRIAARSVSELDSSDYAEKLKASGLVESVLYTGYSFGAGSDGIIYYNFNIDVEV